MTKRKRITITTIKAFIRRNHGKIYICHHTAFDGMTDGIEMCSQEIVPVEPTDSNLENTLGISGAWFVRHGKNYFKQVEKPGMKGYHVYNSCGSFDLLVYR